MENNASCTTVGIVSIRIKMFDGVVKTLIEVRHLQELKRNLISLGVFDYSGYKFSCQGRVLKVSKGILVVMKATKVGNLYRLEWSIEMNEATMVSKEANESTYLWNQRLGHVSEKGLKVLINYKLLTSLKTLNLNLCRHCVFGKQCRQEFKSSSHTNKQRCSRLCPFKCLGFIPYSFFWRSIIFCDIYR